MKKGVTDIRNRKVFVKVGAFFIGAIALAFITLLSIREVTFLKGTYLLKVRFDFAEGLRSASPIRFCGVDVGEVKRVEIKEDNKGSFVFVHAKIQEDIRIPSNAVYFINSLSLFGEKYLEISSPNESDGFISPGAVVEGISPTPLFEVFSSFSETMHEIQKVVEKEEVQTAFHNTLMNIENLTFGMNELINDVRNTEGTVGRLLYDDSLYTKTEEFIDDLKVHPWKLFHRPRPVKERK